MPSPHAEQTRHQGAQPICRLLTGVVPHAPQVAMTAAADDRSGRATPGRFPAPGHGVRTDRGATDSPGTGTGSGLRSATALAVSLVTVLAFDVDSLLKPAVREDRPCRRLHVAVLEACPARGGRSFPNNDAALVSAAAFALLTFNCGTADFR